MCGIVGFKSTCVDYNSESLCTMSESVKHRGPDAEGYYTNQARTVCFAHRRLSIIDVSVTADQPMYSACRRYVIIYNGEVYNFKNLRNKLPGHSWQTHGDTEVILELFARFGPESFSWLNGMFAFAIYDIEDDVIFLARDHLGIKPLFYYQGHKSIVFASELKSVRQYLTTNAIKPGINKHVVPYFLHLGFIPEPHTIYKNVFKFPAASYGIINSGTPEIVFKKYWKAETFLLHDPVNVETVALKQYRQLLFESVESQMISDVPLGTFLSGGIDSSLVTAVASKIQPQKLKTFCIGFQENRYDESGYAAAVAKHLNTDHTELKVSVEDILGLISNLPDVYDEPFADSSAFPTMLISELARRHVKVTLSGDGGDELFLGYGMYTWAKRLNASWAKVLRQPLYQTSKLMNNRLKRAGTLFNYSSSLHLTTHVFSQEQYYFSENELKTLLIDHSFNFDSINTQAEGPCLTAGEKQAFWDLNHYLKDDLLVKVDRASMHYSLESRVPLLDKKLVEFSLNLGASLKVKKNYGTKYLMKKVLYELVPAELFKRPKKGFAIPLKEWLKGPLNYLVTDFLNENIIRNHNVVCYTYVQNVLARFNSGEDFLYNRIWTLIVLHWWLEKYPG